MATATASNATGYGAPAASVTSNPYAQNSYAAPGTPYATNPADPYANLAQAQQPAATPSVAPQTGPYPTDYGQAGGYPDTSPAGNPAGNYAAAPASPPASDPAAYGAGQDNRYLSDARSDAAYGDAPSTSYSAGPPSDRNYVAAQPRYEPGNTGYNPPNVTPYQSSADASTLPPRRDPLYRPGQTSDYTAGGTRTAASYNGYAASNSPSGYDSYGSAPPASNNAYGTPPGYSAPPANGAAPSYGAPQGYPQAYGAPASLR
jgi:hypothetical protein